LRKYVNADINIEIKRVNGFFVVKGTFNVTSEGLTKEETISNFKEEFELYFRMEFY